MNRPVLVFDMDGVLVDVTGSYRATIVETIRHFTGLSIDHHTIQEWKNRGGYNNDWLLCHHYCRQAGVDVSYETVVERFNGFFFGEGGGGLILQEKWIPRPGLLDELAARYRLAIFTGRDRRELAATLERFGLNGRFDPVVTSEDVARGKPAPDGLLLIRRRYPASSLVFVGDTVDDAASAQAAGVPFIGVAAADAPRREELAAALRSGGATAVIEDINQIGAVLPA